MDTWEGKDAQLVPEQGGGGVLAVCRWLLSGLTALLLWHLQGGACVVDGLLWICVLFGLGVGLLPFEQSFETTLL